MKSFLIIGMGRFEHHITINLAKQGAEIMIVDTDQAKMEDLLSVVTSAKIGDCTNEEVLKTLGVKNFDMCIVCIGTNFQSSLEITSLLKEMGARHVVSKATRDIHAKFLLRNGADEVIYPDRDIAEKLAVSYSSDKIFDYIELGGNYAIYEIPVMKEWVGHSIKALNFRSRYNVNILGTKGEDDRTSLMPTADYVFEKDVHLLVVGTREDVLRIIKKI